MVYLNLGNGYAIYIKQEMNKELCTKVVQFTMTHEL